MNTIDNSAPYYTAEGLAARCRYVWNREGFYVNDNIKNDWAFSKMDFVQYLLKKLDAENRDVSVLITHNSDFPTSWQPNDLPISNSSADVAEWVSRRCAGRDDLQVITNRPSLRYWFAVNADTEHKKIVSLPYGCSSDQSALLNEMSQKHLPKTNMFYANYNISNHGDRKECLRLTNIPIAGRVPFDEYLKQMSQAYFCLSPRGNGLDTIRTWDSLLVGTIPVVIRGLINRDYADVPMVALDSWADFKNVNFSKEMYHRLWGAFDAAAICHTDGLLTRVKNICGVSS